MGPYQPLETLDELKDKAESFVRPLYRKLIRKVVEDAYRRGLRDGVKRIAAERRREKDQ